MLNQSDRRSLSVILAACIAAGAARAGEPEKSDDATLRGPKVEQPSSKPSLVERNFEGDMKQLQTRPELAALEKLDLSAAEKQGVERVMSARTALLERTLYDNMALFLEVQGLRQSGAIGPNASGDAETRRKAREKMVEMTEKLQPLLTPRLADSLAAELTAEHQEKFRAMLKEFADESTANERDASRQQRPAARAGRSAERAEVGNTLRELARTLASIVDERRARTEELLRTVQATPEQEEKIRSIVRESAAPGGPDASPTLRAERLQKIMAVLTPEQRQALIQSRRDQAK